MPADRGDDAGRGDRLGRVERAGAAVQQRAEDVEDRRVPVDAAQVQDGLVGAEVDEVLPDQRVDDRPVGERGALRPAGGAGGVEHAGQVVGVRRRGGRVGRLGRERLRCQGDRDPVRHQMPPGGLDQHQVGAGVGGEQLQPAARVARVQRQVRRPGLEDAEQADDQVDGAFGAEPDDPLRAGAAPPQVVGDPVGPRVQLGVADRAVGRGQRDPVRVGGDLGGQDRHHAPVVPGRAGGLGAGGGRDGDAGCGLRVGDHLGQQRAVRVGQPLHLPRGHPAGVRLEGDPLRTGGDHQPEVRPGDLLDLLLVLAVQRVEVHVVEGGVDQHLAGPPAAL
ncbi:hypothetical protein B0E53_06265 [Micromonospora sp. MH33]|nr:hypothetical protein B0E53_06265 [Micromonospora sp. MH33]